MCEWLSCGDWCDVRLMCGGRSFNAHRAVLASVSGFLRKVLLTCPADESPVIILLPDFDIETMCSVLYYIYNGEVLIPNRKMKMFLDTAVAMDIFIDEQYMPQWNDGGQYFSGTKTSNEILPMENYNVCKVKLCSGKNRCFINVRKGMEYEELIRNMQEPVGTLNLSANPIQTFRWTEANVPDLANLTSTSGYRHRQSFLRDIFIETYSQDGNVNGQTPRVLAISNEEHGTISSDLFTDDNGKVLSSCETFSDTSKSTMPKNNTTSSIYNYLKQLHENNCISNNKSNIKISYTLCNQLPNNIFNTEPILGKESKAEYNNNSWKNHTLSSFSLGSKYSFLSLAHKNVISSPNLSFEVPDKCNCNIKSNWTQNESSCITEKATILNEVLQSPWHPRQPTSYRPHKKSLVSLPSERNNDNDEVSVRSKDKYNNSGNVLNEIMTSEQDLKCTICQETFTSNQDYSTHTKRHLLRSRYSCDECHKTFSQLRNFKYHMSVHRGTKEFAATCSVCGKHFNDRGYLSNHMKIHRNRKEYKCASCPKSFNQRVAFNMHVRIHTGVKPHVCDECGKAFSRKMLLKQHQRTHSGERPYACAHCDKRFADRSNMTLHLRLHTGVKPFSCTMCPKSFTKKHHLKSHMNFHTGAKPYSCPRCKLAFTQSSNMRTHFKKCNIEN